MENRLYIGHVMHARLRPFRHKFRYWVYQLLLDIDRLDQQAAKTWSFSHNRFNLLSFYDSDHGAKDGSSLRTWANQRLIEQGLEPDAPIYLLSFPRVLGYVFNPISIWFCANKDEMGLQAILYEVSNTIGQTHSYVVPIHDQNALKSHQAKKQLHVSPFFQREGGYQFSITEPSEKLKVLIRYGSKGEENMVASLRADAKAFTDTNLLTAFIKQPFMTFKVFIGILWEALKLKLKGAVYFSYPKPVKPNASPGGQDLDAWEQEHLS